MARFPVVCAGVCVAVLATGCLAPSREVTVSRRGSPDAQREYYRNELISYDGLALESENFIRGNLMQDDLLDDPLTVLRKLNEFFKVSGNPKFLLIAADLCRYLATQVDEEESIRYHLSNLHYSTSYFRSAKAHAESDGPSFWAKKVFSHDVTLSQAFQCYNEACGGIFSYLRKRGLLGSSAVSLRDRENREFVLEKPEFNLSLPPESIEDFSLCADYQVEGLRQINRTPGTGVPLVATVKEKQWYSSLRTPSGLTVPVTCFIERVDKDNGPVSLRLRFIDTYRQEVLEGAIGDIDKIKIHLALDFSTPMACFLNTASDRSMLSKIRDPLERASGEGICDGLYMIEPYQPNKIPVVFVHGLMSHPETWVQMINSLKNDPTVRSRYQFWFFTYSTGAPVVHSAHKLRMALLAAEKEFCTTSEATENFNRMVIVGHSMGGLLTRLMVQKDPHYLFEAIYKTPWDQIQAKLQPKDFEVLDSFSPHPLPFVHRVVFMAVPHRGSEGANALSARLASRLIRLPKSLAKKKDAIERINRTLIPDYSGFEGEMGNDFFTGIDNLSPDSRFALANGNSPLKEDLTYHSIIGDIDRAGATDGSDGVVAYSSSHMDNAASELVVKANHSVQRWPAAIQELLRILLLHLKP